MMESRITSSRCSQRRPWVSAFASGADLNDAVAVGRIGIDALRRDVHPAYVVRLAVAKQLGVEVVHPIRIRLAQTGPFVAGALGKALQVDELVIEIHAARARAAFEFGLAKSGSHLVDVHGFAIHREDRVDGVKIGVVRTPEARAVERSGRLQNGFPAAGYVGGTTAEAGANPAVRLHNYPPQLKPEAT